MGLVHRLAAFRYAGRRLGRRRVAGSGHPEMMLPEELAEGFARATAIWCLTRLLVYGLIVAIRADY